LIRQLLINASITSGLPTPINCTVTGALLTTMNSDHIMISITTEHGLKLCDQRGTYLYDQRQGEEPTPICWPDADSPVRWSLQQMIEKWAEYSVFGTYELHLW